MLRWLTMPRATVVGYGLAAIAGAGLNAVNVPLAWILGPLLVSAVLAIVGCNIDPPIFMRRLGQLAIGSAVGLNMTFAVLLQLIGWLPIMLVSAMVMILISAVYSVLLGRLAGIDRMTAFFASLPGGLAEMGNIGAQIGASPEPIAIVQTLRVALTVLIVPTTFIVLGLAGTATPLTGPTVPLPWVLILCAAGSVGAVILGFLRLNNPWMIGALLTTAGFTAAGFVQGRIPMPFFWIGQLLIGYAVGSRFRPEMLKKLPRVSAAGVVSVLCIAATMVAYAGLLAALTSLDFTTAALATSPGGMSEMAATAQNLHLNVALIVAFQVLRAVLVNGFATFHWAAINRSGLLGFLERWIGTGGTGSTTKQ
jgi:membrane AbrB-like protein